MESVISFVFGLIGKWYIWLPIAGVLGYFTFLNKRRVKTIRELEHTLLILEVPRTNEKNELAAEQMFASLHGILHSRRELAAQGGLQEHTSFEIAAVKNRIKFYVWVPKHLKNFVESQIYAQYPSVHIDVAEEDYTDRELTQSVTYTGELALTDNEALPIKTFQSFEVDPLAAITATLAKLDEPGEEMWIQFLVRPVSDEWHKKSSRYIRRVKGGRSSSGGMGFLDSLGPFVLDILEALWKPPEARDSKTSTIEITDREKLRLSEAETKSTKLGYQVKIRICYLGNSSQNAKHRMQAIVGTFKQFNSTNLNGFKLKSAGFNADGLAQYRARFFIDSGYTLNTEELASIYHLPHTNVETPNIDWASLKTAEPPGNLPIILGAESDNDISPFGLTNFRGTNQQFGMYRTDRGRHVYVIGQTGTGKSGLLELLALSDIFHNHGYAIIDPHGDFAINNLRFIPPSRIKDVVYFNPADTAFPLAFNPMEVIDPNLKGNTCSEIIGVIKRMFEDSWGPRLEYILRYTILALLEYPGSTMVDIVRMLTNKAFRKEVLKHVTDNVVLQFWTIEFTSWNDRFAAEAVAPILNKVGAFTANPIIRNIIGQPTSSFNIRQMMDEGKILIANLSKGLLGEDNSAILGSLLVTKIQLAAMSRSNIPRIEDRTPFYLYVDEFQNFATDSFATILSEARKYGLNLTVANQYVSQMSDTVRDAIFGNVGTMITLRVSADDAPVLAKPFAPQFLPEDLLNMANRNFVVSMIIKGEKAPTFSGKTLSLPPNQTDFTQQIVEHTRFTYARNRSEVEADIQAAMQHGMPAQNPLTTPGGSPKPPAPKPEEPKRFEQPKPQQPQPKPEPKPQPPIAPKQPVSPPAEASKHLLASEAIKTAESPNKQQKDPNERSDEEHKRKRSRNRRRSGGPNRGDASVNPPRDETELRIR